MSASGSFLEYVRRFEALGDYLRVFAGRPHRVTMLHATADYEADGPAVVSGVLQRADAGEVRLTRKRIDPNNVNRFLGLDLSGSGCLTGTVYLGQRKNADLWAKVYDKRQERLARGKADPGPRVRVEVACMSDVGVTLRDAADPASLFFHFAGASLVERPQGVPEWHPYAEGYVLPPRREYDAGERVEGILRGSADVARICRLAAEGFKGDAASDLARMMRARFKMYVDSRKAEVLLRTAEARRAAAGSA